MNEIINTATRTRTHTHTWLFAPLCVFFHTHTYVHNPVNRNVDWLGIMSENSKEIICIKHCLQFYLYNLLSCHLIVTVTATSSSTSCHEALWCSGQTRTTAIRGFLISVIMRGILRIRGLLPHHSITPPNAIPHYSLFSQENIVKQPILVSFFF